MYSIVFSEHILDELAAIDLASDRRRVLAAIQCLTTNPTSPGIGEAMDASGRVNRIATVGGVAFVFWADHALNKLRILAVKPV